MSYQKIQNALDDHDHKAFLIQYFETIYSGVDLPIPSGLEMDRIQQGWKKIFDEVIEISVPDAFIEALSKEWQTIITQQGGKVDDNFVLEILELLTGQQPEYKQPKSTIGAKQTNNAPAPTPSSKRFYPRRSKPGERRDLPPLADEAVDAAISETYRGHSTESDPDMPVITPQKIDPLMATLRQHYSTNDAHGFLISLFTLSFSNTPPCALPAISGESRSIFQTHWQDTLLLLFEKPGHDTFIEHLHPVWLGIYQTVRQLPDTPSARSAWLTELTATYEKPESPKKPSWLSSWIQTIQDLFRNP